MKLVKIILAVCIAFTVICLASCGGNDAAINNGSDTGVSRSYDTAMDGYDSNGLVKNDAYANDGFADDGILDMTDDVMPYDKSYDMNGVNGNSNLNY